jgi:uncharacterized protein YlxW (UPF0749 family)
MSTILPSIKGKSWVFQVTALCIVLGALLGLSLKTQKQVVKEGGIPDRLPAMRVAFLELKKLNDKLKGDLSYYKDETEKMSQQLAAGTRSSKSLVDALNESKLLAGTVPVRGPGVVVTINDSPKLSPSETRPEEIEQYLVHDYDIRAVVDELFVSGAEAIGINDHRLVANSSIRCVGPVVLVNSERLAPPYVIKAIGEPDVMEKALTLRGGVADDLILFEMITIREEPVIRIPAYGGSTRLKLARPDTQAAGAR